jgi:hypothetical protein
MIKPNYLDFFLAIAGASGALIGLLFVAISVAPERVVGPEARALHQIRATMALTCFVSTLVLSLIALMPDSSIGWPATAIGTAGVLFFVNSLRHLRADQSGEPPLRPLIILVIFLLLMLFLVSSGVRVLVNAHDHGAVTCAAAAAIALLTIGIDRAWELVGGRTSGVAGLVTKLTIGRDESTTQPEKTVDYD